MCETRRVGAVNGSIARRFDMPAIQLCDLPVDLLLTILVSCGPVATAHVSMLLPVLVRAQIDGRRLVDAIAVSFICTFSDALSCEYDARWPWLYHAARLMGLLPNKPHPVWLLNTAADVPRVPPSWFMRAVFCQEAPYAVRTGFPIDLAVLRKMYAIFGMPYTDAAHSKPAWLRFNSDRRFPVISGCDNDWSMELLASRELLGRFLDDLGQLLDSFQQIMSSVFKTKRGGQHVSPAVFDAALSSWTSNAEGTSPWLLELKKGHGSEDDDSDDDGDSYKLETEDEDEVEEEYELEEEYEVEEEEKEEHEVASASSEPLVGEVEGSEAATQDGLITHGRAERGDLDVYAQEGVRLLGAGVVEASGLGLVGGGAHDRVARGAFIDFFEMLRQGPTGFIAVAPEVCDEVLAEGAGVSRAGLAVERCADSMLARIVDTIVRHLLRGVGLNAGVRNCTCSQTREASYSTRSTRAVYQLRGYQMRVCSPRRDWTESAQACAFV